MIIVLKELLGFYYILKRNIISTTLQSSLSILELEIQVGFFDRKLKNNRNLIVLLNYNNKNEIFLEKVDSKKFRYNFNPIYNHRNYTKIELDYKKILNVEKIKILSGKEIIFDFSKHDQKINYKSKIIEIEINETLNKVLKKYQKREKVWCFNQMTLNRFQVLELKLTIYLI